MILYISRKYPPIIGGMENYAYHLHQQFKKNHRVKSIILTKRQYHLVWFFPWVFLYGTYLVFTKKITHVYVGDGVLVSVAVYFQKILRKDVTLTVHGLDVIYQKFGYQRMIRLFLPKIMRIVANSHATKAQVLKRKVDGSKCYVIPVGVEIPDQPVIGQAEAKVELSKELKVNLSNKKILFTVGRLIKRKGVAWFVGHVMPELDDEYIYIVAGTGEELDDLRAMLVKLKLYEKVMILGRISDELKKLIMQSSDVFLSPNITVPGDMEGFGIVNLEAGTYGVPVVAAAVEGVKDAVLDGLTGKLVQEKNVSVFVSAIKEVQQYNKAEIKKHVKKEYSWPAIYNKYWQLMCG